MTNNPTAIALHEANILWPNTKLQCVVSVGTGRFERPEQFEDVEKISLRQKVEKFIQSATNTEGKQKIIDWYMTSFFSSNLTLCFIYLQVCTKHFRIYFRRRRTSGSIRTCRRTSSWTRSGTTNGRKWWRTRAVIVTRTSGSSTHAQNSCNNRNASINGSRTSCSSTKIRTCENLLLIYI